MAYGAVELGEVVVKKCQDFIGQIKQGATNFRKWGGDRVRNLVDAFENFVAMVEEKSREIYNDIIDWIQGGVHWIRDNVGGRGTVEGRKYFGVYVSALTSAGNEMQNYVGRLRWYYNEVDGIQNSSREIKMVLSLGQIKSQLIDLFNTCNKMSDVLENVANKYERTEQVLIEECNLL